MQQRKFLLTKKGGLIPLSPPVQETEMTPDEAEANKKRYEEAKLLQKNYQQQKRTRGERN